LVDLCGKRFWWLLYIFSYRNTKGSRQATPSSYPSSNQSSFRGDTVDLDHLDQQKQIQDLQNQYLQVIAERMLEKELYQLHI